MSQYQYSVHFRLLILHTKAAEYFSLRHNAFYRPCPKDQTRFAPCVLVGVNQRFYSSALKNGRIISNQKPEIYRISLLCCCSSNAEGVIGLVALSTSFFSPINPLTLHLFQPWFRGVQPSNSQYSTIPQYSDNIKYSTILIGIQEKNVLPFTLNPLKSHNLQRLGTENCTFCRKILNFSIFQKVQDVLPFPIFWVPPIHPIASYIIQPKWFVG